MVNIKGHFQGFGIALGAIGNNEKILDIGSPAGMGSSSHDLDLHTFKVTDQMSGRMMGVRADMTPQVARIVSNRLKASDQISRLCYVGEVLKTRNNKAKGSRSPIQVGAEI